MIASGQNESSGQVNIVYSRQKITVEQAELESVDAVPFEKLTGASELVYGGRALDPIYIKPTPEMSKAYVYAIGGSPDTFHSWHLIWYDTWKSRKYDENTEKSITFTESISFSSRGETIGYQPLHLNYGDIIMGGIIKVQMTQMENGKLTTFSNYFKILGKNPDKETVKAELGDLKYQIIGYKESKWRQFIDNKSSPRYGYPLFGAPAGYGVMQLDPVLSYKELWDWKANVKAGKANFDKCLLRSQELPNYVKGLYKGKEPVSNFTEDQILREAFYFYNGGSAYTRKGGVYHPYYKWDTKNNQWVRNDRAVYRSTIYADDAMRIYETISQGGTVPGWF